MNKVNWVDGRYTTPQDFNAMQTEPESHIEGLGRRLPAAVVDGCVPTGAGTVVTIGAGVAWDAAGRRIVIPAGGVVVDMTDIDRPAAGQYRWLTWFATYQRIDRGTMRDKAGIDRPAYVDDSYSVGVRAGAEFTQSSIDEARARQVSTRPQPPAGAVGLGHSILDHATSYAALFTDDTLFRSEAPRPISPFMIHATGATGADLLDLLLPILPRKRDYAIGAGSARITSNRTTHYWPVFLAYHDMSGRIEMHFAQVQPLRVIANVHLDVVFDRVGSYGPAKHPLPATGGW